MLISRTDRGLVANWWFTVDRSLLSAILLLMAVGVLFSLAASPPVAERIGLEPFLFFKRQIVFLVPAALMLIGTSFLDERQVRRAGLFGLVASVVLMLAAMRFGPEIKGAHRWVVSGRSTCSRRNSSSRRLVVMVAWFLAEDSRRPEIPGQLIAWMLLFLRAAILVRAAGFRPDGACLTGIRHDDAGLRHLLGAGGGHGRPGVGGAFRRLSAGAARDLAHRPLH